MMTMIYLILLLILLFGAGVDICEQYCVFVSTRVLLHFVPALSICICTKNLSLEDISLNNFGESAIAATGGYYA